MIDDAKLTDTFINGLMAKSILENRIEEILGLSAITETFDLDIGGDSYDWSLEIMIAGVTPEQLPITKDHIRAFEALGCKLCWVNYHHFDDDGCVGKRYADVCCYTDGQPSGVRRYDEKGHRLP